MTHLFFSVLLHVACRVPARLHHQYYCTVCTHGRVLFVSWRLLDGCRSDSVRMYWYLIVVATLIATSRSVTRRRGHGHYKTAAQLLQYRVYHHTCSRKTRDETTKRRRKRNPPSVRSGGGGRRSSSYCAPPDSVQFRCTPTCNCLEFRYQPTAPTYQRFVTETLIIHRHRSLRSSKLVLKY